MLIWLLATVCLLLFLFETMYNKTFGAANNTYLHLDYPDIIKTSSNNYLSLAGLVTVNVW